ncbi:hypothetical protein [Nonomuraea sp. B19D2]|uniref:hypothetical protein n=1 Tax=Nonomuraea sp. B19D2 TaxID=3159561 RepID=UPI0032DA739C
MGEVPRADGRWAGCSATVQINRRDFGIDITVPMNAGGVAAGDKVSIQRSRPSCRRRPSPGVGAGRSSTFMEPNSARADTRRR